MKIKHFLLILIGIILVMIVAFALQMVFGAQTKEFGLSCGIFFLSIFGLIEYQNALKPKSSGVINRLKRSYEAKGQLPKYQALCKILFLVAIGVGALTLFGGFLDLILHALESVVENGASSTL